jgi:hypothetical protein
MKFDKINWYVVFATVEMVLLFVVGGAMIFEAIYPVDEFFINPSPEQARLFGGAFGALMILFSYTYIKEHELLKIFKKRAE